MAVISLEESAEPLTTALSGMETWTNSTPSTFSSADCTRLTQAIPQVMPVTLSETASAGISTVGLHAPNPRATAPRMMMSRKFFMVVLCVWKEDLRLPWEEKTKVSIPGR